jgi:hypothetical protein
VLEILEILAVLAVIGWLAVTVSAKQMGGAGSVPARPADAPIVTTPDDVADLPAVEMAWHLIDGADWYSFTVDGVGEIEVLVLILPNDTAIASVDGGQSYAPVALDDLPWPENPPASVSTNHCWAVQLPGGGWVVLQVSISGSGGSLASAAAQYKANRQTQIDNGWVPVPGGCAP